MPNRTILHVDMDAFFASVEQRDFPELKGKPVVIGGAADQRGVVSAASYEARKFGIHSAMPLREAHRHCPQAVFRPGRMQAYRQVSKQIQALFEDYTPWVQPLSVDEAFLDVTGTLHLWHHDVLELVADLRQTIRDRFHLTASVGIAPNKFLAKLASDINKPDGMTEVPRDPEAIRNFLAPLDVGRLWGVGAKTKTRLNRSGYHLVSDLQAAGRERLIRELGEPAGEHLFALAVGRDERPVHDPEIEKSISNEKTFSENESDPEELRRTLLLLTEKVGRRLRAGGFWAGCVQIKIRNPDFKTFTRQRQFTRPTCRDPDLLEAVYGLYDTFAPSWPVRLLGVGVTRLQTAPPGGSGQLDLFEPPETDADSKLDETVDAIRNKYGIQSLQRGRGLVKQTAQARGRRE